MLPTQAIDLISLDLFSTVLPILAEAAILMGFGAVMLQIAIRGFRVAA